MKVIPAIVFLAVAVSAVAQRPDAGWSAVPASTGQPVGVALMVPSAPGEDSIRLVGPTAPPPTTPVFPRVFGVALPVAPVRSDARPAAAAIPARARWPDATGRILEDAPAAAGGGTEALRNPWIPRQRPPAPPRSAAFSFGGYIGGGEGGPVGIVNGRSVRRGDAIGDFVVERIIPSGVVLERATGLYVIPLGTRTTITLHTP